MWCDWVGEGDGNKYDRRGDLDEGMMRETGIHKNYNGSFALIVCSLYYRAVANFKN